MASVQQGVSCRIAGWAELKELWRKLEASCDISPFQTWDWVYNFQSHDLGPGEALLLSFEVEGTCVGIVPLAKMGGKGGLKRLTLLGGDYCDILALPEYQEEVVREFLEWLLAHRGTWDLVDIRGLKPGSPLLHPIAVKGLRVEKIPHQEYPAACLPPTWEAYLASLGKSLKTQLRYYPNKLARDHGHLGVTLATAETLDKDIDTLFRLHQMRWESKGKPGIFGITQSRDFHKALAPQFLESGILRLFVLRAGGRAAAAAYCFRLNQETIYYVGGFDTELANYRPLKILIGKAIKSSVEEGQTVFDFIKGEEEYKSEWRAENRQTYRLLITSSGLKSKAVVAALKLEPKVKEMRRKYRAGKGR